MSRPLQSPFLRLIPDLLLCGYCVQCITVQILEALRFLHGLGLLHCDLKPENILVKSYSRCEIKVIDLGSSCFATDHLCSYVQSRSYRAPEVILGLPYSHKIDIWSLGCILAELCSGTVRLKCTLSFWSTFRIPMGQPHSLQFTTASGGLEIVWHVQHVSLRPHTSTVRRHSSGWC